MIQTYRNRIDSALKKQGGAYTQKRQVMIAGTIHRLVAAKINGIEELASNAIISKVEVSSNLESAVIFIKVAPWSSCSDSEVLDMFKQSSFVIKNTIIKGVRLKRFRTVNFKIDKIPDKIMKINAILDDLC